MERLVPLANTLLARSATAPAATDSTKVPVALAAGTTTAVYTLADTCVRLPREPPDNTMSLALKPSTASLKEKVKVMGPLAVAVVRLSVMTKLGGVASGTVLVVS